MATLLHLDSSLNGENSHSRAVTAAFREAWESEHPDGTVVYRDLAADPLPHLTAPAYYAGFSDPAAHTPEEQSAFALRKQLLEEAEQADALLIGAPMYNYSIASGLKTWLDHVIAVGRTVASEQPTLAGKPATVVTSRGGAYGPGTPSEGQDHLQPYLEMILGEKLGLKTDFILAELTMAPNVPAMAELIPLYEKSHQQSRADAETRGRTLAKQLAA
ncbi:NAD(P)H-dependent oxidoreductase [Streptomyces sp. N2-109]|uniref:FMN dependent NADH:quinone oxidoreductase n=1 Tax=Streptomyces gossypii TaxID=2883101 RepID=A0ABT2JMK9_9ACTN|nr:NAD(P)H-dependent oxidoreductase [Streptomyces gossypii]MCT2589123.1 NAD(P)H-dependent oxidoreductase [Streptomyces gossypii]